MNPRKFVDVGHLGFRDLAREYPANTLAASMHVQHDLGRAFTIHGEKRLQNRDHEIHRREVIVEQDHLVQRRTHHLRTRLLDGETVSVFGLLFG